LIQIQQKNSSASEGFFVGQIKKIKALLSKYVY